MLRLERENLGGCGRKKLGSGAEKNAFARPGSEPLYAPDQSADMEHLFLDLDLDVKKHTLSGAAFITLKAITHPLKSIRFHAVDLKIEKVLDDAGKKLRYTHDNKILKISFNRPVAAQEKFTVQIVYQLKDPYCGIYFVEPDRAYPKKHLVVWSHGETEEARHWFPCFDAPHDKATTELKVKVPQDFFALSNGALIHTEIDPRSKKKIFHWNQKLPHSTYLVTLVAGRFSEIRDEWDGIPVTYYCQPGREADTRRAFGKTAKMLEFFSRKIGVRYPYEKYAQIAVADFVMGGMEHTTATTQTDRVLMDERAYPEFNADWLVSHELAHQWFGDLLTCKEWAHGWLNESFATYFEALFTEEDLGADEFELEMEDKRQIYFDEADNHYRRAIVTNVYRHPDDLFDRHLYEKGACVLHMLRHDLGDSLFWQSVQHYVKKHFTQAVETQDLINAIQESTGRNMRKFFDQWVYQPGHLNLTARYDWDEKTKTAHVWIDQKPAHGNTYFDLSLLLVFYGPDGEKVCTERLHKKTHHFTYKMTKAPLDFRVDPNHILLKKTVVIKPLAHWQYQLKHDAHILGRSQAAQHLAGTRNEKIVRELVEAFKREKFWGVARELALALGKTKTAAAQKFLLSAFKSAQHPKVRRAVAESLHYFKDAETAIALRQAAQKDKSYFVAAESLRALGTIGREEDRGFLKSATRIKSWNDTISSAAMAGYSQWQDESSLKEAIESSQYGQSLTVRIGAIGILRRLAPHYSEAFSALLALVNDKQIRIQNTAIDMLGALKNPKAIPILEPIAKSTRVPYRTAAHAEDALLKINPDWKK